MSIKIKKLKYSLVLISLFFSPLLIISQDNWTKLTNKLEENATSRYLSERFKENDSINGIYAKKILKNWFRLEDKFKNAAFKRLLDFLEEDPILKTNFLENDSINFKNLKLIIRPVLKFKKEAKEYKVEQYIFDFIEFDTIDFHSVSQFYLADTLCFIITRGYNEFDIAPILVDCPPIEFCTGDYYFNQYFYLIKKESDPLNLYPFKKESGCWNLNPSFKISNDSSFIFCIDGVVVNLTIDSNKIKVYGNPCYKNDLLGKLYNKPSEYIICRYDEQHIRDCAENLPVGGKVKKKKPWWQFW